MSDDVCPNVQVADRVQRSLAKEKQVVEEFKHRMKVIGDDDHGRNTTLAQKKFQGVGPVGGNAARGKPKKATRVV